MKILKTIAQSFWFNLLVSQQSCFLFLSLLDFSAGLGVLNMAVQALSRMAGNSDLTARNQFFLIDKEV